MNQAVENFMKIMGDQPLSLALVRDQSFAAVVPVQAD